jgi:hypothetical protein
MAKRGTAWFPLFAFQSGIKPNVSKKKCDGDGGAFRHCDGDDAGHGKMRRLVFGFVRTG